MGISNKNCLGPTDPGTHGTNFGGSSRRIRLLLVRGHLCSALELIESSVRDVETLEHLRDALAELDAELAKGPSAIG